MTNTNVVTTVVTAPVSKEFCMDVNKKYQVLHHNPYAMLGDSHFAFYFSPLNFELYGLLSSSSYISILRDWKQRSQLSEVDFLMEIGMAMAKWVRHPKLRKKQIQKALAFYRY